MNPEDSKQRKRPFNAERPFPWQCRHCGKKEVVMSTTAYAAEVRHDGRLHTFTIPNIEIPVCQACGEKVFTGEVDRQISKALVSHLKLLTPSQIRDALERVKMTQKEVAKRLGIAEATLSRWLNETQIQSRSMDNLLRTFFAFPQVRTALCGQSQNSELGTSDLAEGNRRASARQCDDSGKDPNWCARAASWLERWNGKRQGCRRAQELVQVAGSTWGGSG